jgi:hypothetical protein
MWIKLGSSKGEEVRDQPHSRTSGSVIQKESITWSIDAMVQKKKTGTFIQSPEVKI